MQSHDTSLASLARLANQEHDQAQTCFRSGVQHAERARRALISAKGKLAHGQWTAWLAENFHGSERTAQLYMRLARHMGETDDETRNAIAEMALRDAAKDMAAPRRIRVHVTEMPVRSSLVVLRCAEGAPEPADREVPPSARSPILWKGASTPKTVQRDTRRDPVDPITTEIAALVAQSRTRAPSALSGDLARAGLTAADLEQLAAWVSDAASALLDLEARTDKVVQYRGLGAASTTA